jgi:hypothetical protein
VKWQKVVTQLFFSLKLYFKDITMEKKINEFTEEEMGKSEWNSKKVSGF